MPIREYECPNCGRFERLELSNDFPLNVCEKCNSSLTKLISAPGGYILNGPGFYSNDYQRTEQRKLEKCEKCERCEKNGGPKTAKYK